MPSPLDRSLFSCLSRGHAAPSVASMADGRWVSLAGGQHVYVSGEGEMLVNGPRGTREKAAAAQVKKGQTPLPAGHAPADDERGDAHTNALIAGAKWARKRKVDIAGEAKKSLAQGHDHRQFVGRFKGASGKEKKLIGDFYKAMKNSRKK